MKQLANLLGCHSGIILGSFSSGLLSTFIVVKLRGR